MGDAFTWFSPAAQQQSLPVLLALVSISGWHALWYVLTSLVVLMLAVSCPARWRRVVNWHQLHKHGPAETSYKRLQQSADKVVVEDLLHWGRVVYVGRHDVAAQVFKSSAFISRLGSDHGLKLLRMHEQGVIWNNDTTDWQVKRQYFAKGVQELVVQRSTHAKHITITAFKQTLAEHCHQAVNTANKIDSSISSRGTRSKARYLLGQLPSVSELVAMPLCDLASAVAGIYLDLPDGRDLFRLVAFRVTVALTFGLPVNALEMTEALQVVHQVAAFFKAWEYFLLRPKWLCQLTSFTTDHKRHISAITALQQTTVGLINKAKAIANPGDLDGCFLGKLVADQAAGKLSQESVEQLALEMLLAGTDTSSISLYYLMVALADDPGLERQLMMEVMEAAGDINGLSDSGLAAKLPTSPGYDPQLPKCQAALCEAMRFKPVGPVSIRQAVHPVTLHYTSVNCGENSKVPAPVVLYLQPGDTVIVSLAVMHRDPTVYAAPDNFCPFQNFNANSFRYDKQSTNTAQPVENPHRAAMVTALKDSQPSKAHAPESFLTAGVSAAVTGDKASDAFRPFGHGRKGCVGRELGWLEMKVMLACWLLTMRFIDGSDDSKPDVDSDNNSDADGNHSSSSSAHVLEQCQAATPAVAAVQLVNTITNAASGATRSVGGISVTTLKAAANTNPDDYNLDANRLLGLQKSTNGASHNSGSMYSKLSQMTTKWEVASQPVNPEPLYARCVPLAGPSRIYQTGGMPSRIYIVGPHSSGKTTLCNALLQAHMPGSAKPVTGYTNATSSMSHLGGNGVVHITAGATATDSSTGQQGNAANCKSTLGSKYVFITETARSVMKAHGITRAQLTDQSCRNNIIAANNTTVISDSIRSVGGDQSSRDVFFHFQQLIVHEQLRRECQLIAGNCPLISDRAVVDPLAYTAERYGIQSPQLHMMMSSAATQELLQSCRHPSSIVLFIPPFDNGNTAPVDDGVRLISSTTALTAVYKQLMQQLQIPYEVVQASSLADRVQEVLALIGAHSYSSKPCGGSTASSYSSGR